MTVPTSTSGLRGNRHLCRIAEAPKVPRRVARKTKTRGTRTAGATARATACRSYSRRKTARSPLCAESSRKPREATIPARTTNLQSEEDGAPGAGDYPTASGRSTRRRGSILCFIFALCLVTDERWRSCFCRPARRVVRRWWQRDRRSCGSGAVQDFFLLLPRWSAFFESLDYLIRFRSVLYTWAKAAWQIMCTLHPGSTHGRAAVLRASACRSTTSTCGRGQMRLSGWRRWRG